MRASRVGGRTLLRRALGRASGDRLAEPGDLRLDLEEGRMGRAAGRERAVDRETERAPLRPLLKPRLRIARRFGIGGHRRRPVAADEALGGIEAAVDIEGADDRLAGIRQVGRIVASTGGALASAHGESVAEREPAGHALQCLTADQRGKAL